MIYNEYDIYHFRLFHQYHVVLDISQINNSKSLLNKLRVNN